LLYKYKVKGVIFVMWHHEKMRTKFSIPAKDMWHDGV
jgi:hypothetical protein